MIDDEVHKYRIANLFHHFTETLFYFIAMESKEFSELKDQLVRIEQKLDNLNAFEIIEEYQHPCDYDIATLEKDMVMMKGSHGDLRLKIHYLERMYKILSLKLDANINPPKKTTRKRKCNQEVDKIKKLKNEDVDIKN